jgi:hypothetical protein
VPLFTSAQAARSTLAALRYLTVLPRTVHQGFEGEFVSGRGQTVNVLSPITAGASRTYTKANRDARAAIVFDTLDQTWVPVTIEDQVYKAIRLPDDWATFSLTSLEQQVLKPQATSVVDGVTAPLIAKMNAVANAPTVGAPGVGVPALLSNGSNAIEVLIRLRAILNARKVPMSDRFFAITPAAEAAFLNVPQLQKANEAGTDGLLREATIGRLMGFTIVTDPSLTKNVAYHRDAFVHVSRPSRNPEGAAKSATIQAEGFGLRWLQHYNPLQLEDQSVVDTFVGAETLDPLRAVAVANPT